MGAYEAGVKRWEHNTYVKTKEEPNIYSAYAESIMGFTSQYLNGNAKHFDNHAVVFISGLYKTGGDSHFFNLHIFVYGSYVLYQYSKFYTLFMIFM